MVLPKLFIYFLGIPLWPAIGAFTGLVCLVIGHAILKLTDMPIYDLYSINSSARVGAAGGAVISFPIMFVGIALADLPWEIQGGLDTILFILFMLATVGTGQELLHQANQPVMEVLDYIKAALVGQAVFSVAIVLSTLMMFLTCGFGIIMSWRMGWTRGEKDERDSSFDLESDEGSEDMLPVDVISFFFPPVEEKSTQK